MAGWPGCLGSPWTPIAQPHQGAQAYTSSSTGARNSRWYYQVHYTGGVPSFEPHPEVEPFLFHPDRPSGLRVLVHLAAVRDRIQGRKLVVLAAGQQRAVGQVKSIDIKGSDAV